MNGKLLLAFVLVGGAALVIGAKCVRFGSQKENSYTPANFFRVPELTSNENVAITEAAYHQQPSDFVPALGFDENVPADEEVINLS
jgi:hypothetical protein